MNVLISDDIKSNDSDELILHVLKEKPLSTEALCILTGLQKQAVLRKIHKLEKYGLVTISTIKRTYWWKTSEVRP
jgi:predicted transcriptional regulator